MEPRLCIDTDIIIDYLRGRDRFYERILQSIPFLYISAVTSFELWCGARNEQESKVVENAVAPLEIIPFGEKESREAARVYRYLKARGEMMGIKDVLIAGTVLANNLPLITRNARDFGRIPGIKIFKE